MTRRGGRIKGGSFLQTLLRTHPSVRMHFITNLFAIASVLSMTSASILMERQCTALFAACLDSAPNCCEGLTCTTGSPLGNCMPTPGVCGAAGVQCTAAIPTDTCCEGLTCSAFVGIASIQLFHISREESLLADRILVYLIHWPVALNPNGNHPAFPTLPNGLRDVVHDWKLSDTWKQMEALVEKKKVKAIGISNFSVKKMEEILPSAKIIPAVNQLELHPYNPQHELLAYLRSKGIVPEAYSPLGSTNSPLLKDEVVKKIAEKHGLQPSDVLLGWLVSHGIVALPKSVTPSRIASNLTGTVAAVGKLDKEDITQLDGLAAGGKQKRFIMPPWPVALGFDNWTAPFPQPTS
ncbi:hypothetical protein D9757_004446 [Collybiopsis confluens]|uniref:NADP-dependent oxidoreductase domain-containing protein n=1 Tax=Collybiopsis confluens TaxID=2823264 RepID=A0A8H5MEI0_9AGAR|nr:hypothetical protein D9757_004446 [Collybiopsis confluens]